MVERITGYAVRFNEETIIAGTFREKIARGAFNRSLREHPDVLALIGHNRERVLGRTSASTLELRADSIGLYFDLTPDPTTPDGMTAIGTVRRQDVAGCSFGFIVKAEEWDDGGDRLPLRTITDADLIEISLVGEPAYETTSAALLDRSPDGDPRQKSLLSANRARAAMRTRGIKV